MGALWALTPILWRLLIVGGLLLSLAGTITGVVYKIKHDAIFAERQQVEKEKNDAIRKANKAREILRSRCAIDPSSCVPDEWFRDE